MGGIVMALQSSAGKELKGGRKLFVYGQERMIYFSLGTDKGTEKNYVA